MSASSGGTAFAHRALEGERKPDAEYRDRRRPATGIPSFDLARLSEKERNDLLYQGPGLVYVLRPGAKALVIGAGGGWDLARALASGCRDVTGVEINPIIATTIMRQRFPDLSRRLYFRPEVRIRVEEGRAPCAEPMRSTA